MINDLLPTVPYVNSQMLADKRGKQVRLIGRVDQVSQDGLKAKLEAPDHGTVMVVRLPGSTPYTTQFVVITGKVNDDLTVTEESSESFGSTFGMINFMYNSKLL